jgi:hypothetical protein
LRKHYKRIRQEINRGYIIALTFGRGAVEEVARLKREENIEIVLKKVGEIIPIAHKPKIKLSYDWREAPVPKRSGGAQGAKDGADGEKEITFTAAALDLSVKIELWQWDFSFNGTFNADIMLDIGGVRNRG